jgi:hypothetical protein
MGPGVPVPNPRTTAPLTSTRCPALSENDVPVTKIAQIYR